MIDRNPWLKFAVIAGVGILFLTGCSQTTNSENDNQGNAKASEAKEKEVEIVPMMGDFQRFTMKMKLSINNENRRLAKFYLHELEEVAEGLADVEQAEGFPVGSMVKSILIPELEGMDGKLEKNPDWPAVQKQYESLVRACNNCHMATENGFIQVTESINESGYNQSFSPRR
ncbi:MAG: hypothetical protein ABEK50_09735 [bacterium]